MHYDDELFDEEKEISIDELVEALSGEDEDGDPKSVVECSLYKLYGCPRCFCKQDQLYGTVCHGGA